MRRTAILPWILCCTVAACASGSGDYDPDWDPTSPMDGKADGITDIVPNLQLGGTVSGEVGGERVELFSIDLQRTDRIELAMEVTDGDLDPHVSLFYGTHTYIHSESWERDGDVLRKVYEVEDAGRYLIAARAYEGRGAGTYSITATCLGGPCNGEFPPVWSEMEVRHVATCIARARRCSFDRLPSYGGAVGDTRANQIFTGCLETVALDDGSSCAAACEFEGDEEDRVWDDAAPLCNSIKASLVFYADQSEACLSTLDDCMGECYDAAQYGYYGWESPEEIGDSTEAMCWDGGFNGTCDGYARMHQACGGQIVPESAGECTALCHSTTGAHIDDLDTLCSYDSDCEDYCDVAFPAAGAACGGLTSEAMGCLQDFLDETHAWTCEDSLMEAIPAP